MTREEITKKLGEQVELLAELAKRKRTPALLRLLLIDRLCVLVNVISACDLFLK